MGALKVRGEPQTRPHLHDVIRRHQVTVGAWSRPKSFPASPCQIIPVSSCLCLLSILVENGSVGGPFDFLLRSFREDAAASLGDLEFFSKDLERD